MGRIKEQARRYALAVLAALVALLLREAFSPFLGQRSLHQTVWVAVVFASWYCGLGPAVVTTLMSAVGVWYLFLPSFRSFHLQDLRPEIAGLIGFVLLSGFIIALGEANRRAKTKLIEARDELDTRVQERTADLKQAEETARRLSGRILSLQDDERRRIARGLHDSLGQYLAALKMNLDLLPTSHDNKARIASDCSEIVGRCLTETRTISYLLHPPLLDESGFASAAHWYVEGFAQRSGIKVDIDLPVELGRLHRDAEIALFRVVQEALTNVHRHSHASEVDIRVTFDSKRVHLEIKDNGRGIPQECLKHLIQGHVETGVGIAGMRERVRELGGSLEIRSKEGIGTEIIVTVPLIEKRATQVTEDADSSRTISAG